MKQSIFQSSVTWWLGWTVIGSASIFSFMLSCWQLLSLMSHSSPSATHLNKLNKKAQVLLPLPPVRSSKPLIRTLIRPTTNYHKNSKLVSSSGSLKPILECLAAMLFFPASLIIWVINLFNSSWDMCVCVLLLSAHACVCVCCCSLHTRVCVPRWLW